MTSVQSVQCLSLLTPAQEAAWIGSFGELGYSLICHSALDDESSQQLTAFTLLQATQFSEVSRTLQGCVHFPPLVVVLQNAPEKAEIEQLRHMGTACLLIGEPCRDLARQIMNQVGQSQTWFKGIGQWAHLPDVLQFVASGGRAVLVTVTGSHSKLIDEQNRWEELKPLTEDEESAWYGRIYVENGMVIHAEVPEGKVGDQAVAALLKVHDGVVRVLDTFLPPPRVESPRSIQGCLLNAVYLIDESERSDSLNESLEFGEFTTPMPLESSMESPLKSIHAAQAETAEAPAAADPCAQFQEEAQAIACPALLQTSHNGQLIYSKPGFEDGDMIAAVASECQRLFEQIAQRFGASRASSWNFSTESTTFYGAEMTNGDLIIAADAVTKSPHTVLRQVENIAHKLSEN